MSRDIKDILKKIEASPKKALGQNSKTTDNAT